MTIPSILLGFVIASLLGTLFHLWRGGGAGRILFYLVLAWLGFFAGHLIAGWLGWPFLQVGPLNLGMAITGSILLLFSGDWLKWEDAREK